MGKNLLFFLLCCLLSGVTIPLSSAHAADSESTELDQLLEERENTDEGSAEEDYALPVPAPSESGSPVLEEKEDAAVQASRNEDLYLPVPSDQAASTQQEELEEYMPFTGAGEVRYETDSKGYNKPGFSLFGGYANKQYQATTAVPNAKDGIEVGLSGRILGRPSFGAPISLNAFGAVTFITVDDVLGVQEGRPSRANGVKDITLRVGALLELDLSRRFQLMGGLFRYMSEISVSSAIFTDSTGGSAQGGPIASQLTERRFSFGVGAQWDFYVVPHGSVGARFWVEPRYYSVLLTFALEPVPRNRNSLNFEWDD